LTPGRVSVQTRVRRGAAASATALTVFREAERPAGAPGNMGLGGLQPRPPGEESNGNHRDND
ncbi:MAG: hypothetical protein PVI07_12715, partial [Anaerolineae bacterium]